MQSTQSSQLADSSTVIQREEQMQDLDPTTTESKSESITITMLYFASARTTLDKSSESLTLPCPAPRPESSSNSSSATIPNTATILPQFPISHLKGFLLQKYGNEYPDLKIVLAKSALSLNEEIAYEDDDTIKLREGDVVAIIPPVSGG